MPQTIRQRTKIPAPKLAPNQKQAKEQDAGKKTFNSFAKIVGAIGLLLVFVPVTSTLSVIGVGMALFGYLAAKASAPNTKSPRR